MKLLSIISNAMALEALKKSVACVTLVPSIDILSVDKGAILCVCMTGNLYSTLQIKARVLVVEKDLGVVEKFTDYHDT